MVSICQIDSGLVVKVHNWSAVGLPLTSDQISIGIHGVPWFTDENMCLKIPLHVSHRCAGKTSHDSGLVAKVHNWSAMGLPLTGDQISIGIHGLPWFTDENMCIKIPLHVSHGCAGKTSHDSGLVS